MNHKIVIYDLLNYVKAALNAEIDFSILELIMKLTARNLLNFFHIFSNY